MRSWSTGSEGFDFPWLRFSQRFTHFIRIYFLNSSLTRGTSSIAAQSAWLHLSYEVLQEALLLPLYYVFGQVIRDLPALRDINPRFRCDDGCLCSADADHTDGC